MKNNKIYNMINKIEYKIDLIKKKKLIKAFKPL